MLRLPQPRQWPLVVFGSDSQYGGYPPLLETEVSAPFPATSRGYLAVKTFASRKWARKVVSRMGGMLGDGLSTTLSPVILDYTRS